MIDKDALSPMMKQYLEIKEKHPSEILFFRLGDFYEMFFDDAIKASEILEITLTGKDCGLPKRAPMCGIPYHSANSYIARLIKEGENVAICEQVEDPKDAKGIVKREVIKIITPGTCDLDEVLDKDKNNFICAIYAEGENFGVTFADITTGEVFSSEASLLDGENTLSTLFTMFRPTEVILDMKAKRLFTDLITLKKRFGFCDRVLDGGRFNYESSLKDTKKQFGDLEKFNMHDKPYALTSLGGLMDYLYMTQKSDFSHMKSIVYIDAFSYLNIDANSFRSLELTENMRDKSKKGTLLWALDKTKTAMGARKLSSWIERPLVNDVKINQRLDAVSELIENTPERESLRDLLKKIYDIERLLSKVVYSSCNARDFLSLKQSIAPLGEIKSQLKNFKSDILHSIYENLDPLRPLWGFLEQTISPDAPLTVKDGGIIKEGYSDRLDYIRGTVTSSEKFTKEIEERERENTGIKNLKVGYNKVFGYFIEVTKSYLDKVPPHYIRRQTLVNAERFTTVELKEHEGHIVSASHSANAMEYEIFLEAKSKILDAVLTLKANASYISTLDVLCSLAKVAYDNNFVRPIVDKSDILDIKEGRHFVVEKTSNDLFVPNDTYLDTEDNRFIIITGPNMAGKSTYMRQCALCVVMAQIGSYVSASYAHIGVCDKIFTRVGASDDLSQGQSTFMVEMNEVSYILKNATQKSLVILDEIGRGTSTFDGLSIAWAVSEYISNKSKIGAKTLFATHYHELVALENEIDGVKNYSVLVKKHGDDITFLRKIVKGGTPDSFGIEVAILAGLPKEVTNRAKQVLKSLEGGDVISYDENLLYDMSQFETPTEKETLKEEILKLDVQNLTPIEALNELYKLWKKASE